MKYDSGSGSQKEERKEKLVRERAIQILRRFLERQRFLQSPNGEKCLRLFMQRAPLDRKGGAISSWRLNSGCDINARL